MGQFRFYVEKYLSALHIPSNIGWIDIVEILIISFLVYKIIVWIKNTKAWSLLKGMLVIMFMVSIAAIFNMTTILWIAQNVFGIAVTALVVIMQPELRRALEQLGSKNIIGSVIKIDTRNTTGRFNDNTMNEIIRASFEMGKARTGALIVIEQNISLAEYERTGITIDALESSQLLINIFEHNTPLHDGAVIVRGDRVVSATCYLPLSDNMQLSKELGTRHRAGVGISEATDSLTIIISEETGKVSVAYQGKLERNLDMDELRKRLVMIQNKSEEEKEKKYKHKKGRKSIEEKNNE